LGHADRIGLSPSTLPVREQQGNDQRSHLLDPTTNRRQMMSSYVQLGEVHTYYEEDGSGEPLVLLHHGGAADWWRRCACSD
jgi:hypothetical protein